MKCVTSRGRHLKSLVRRAALIDKAISSEVIYTLFNEFTVLCIYEQHVLWDRDLWLMYAYYRVLTFTVRISELVHQSFIVWGYTWISLHFVKKEEAESNPQGNDSGPSRLVYNTDLPQEQLTTQDINIFSIGKNAMFYSWLYSHWNTAVRYESGCLCKASQNILDTAAYL